MNNKSQKPNKAGWFALSIFIGFILLLAALPGIISSPKSQEVSTTSFDSWTSDLKDKDPNIRIKAADALGNGQNDYAVVPLIQILNDADPNVRLHAATALNSLIDSADAESMSSIQFSIAGSGNINILIAALQDENPEIRSQVAGALGHFMDSPIYDLTSRLEVDVSSQGIDVLIAALQDENPNVRMQATWLLGYTKKTGAIGPLTSALKDGDPNVRLQAVQALGNLYLDGSVDPLISALKDEDPKVRIRAARMLGWLGKPGCVDSLVATLEDVDPHVRFQAAISLLGTWSIEGVDEHALDTMIALLKNEDPDLRIQVLQELINNHDARAIMPVIEVLNDKDANVRSQAATTLGYYYVGYVMDEFYVLKDKDPGLYEREVDGLIAALQDENPDVRRMAAKALGNSLSPRALDPLLAMLKDGDANDRLSAVRALGYTRDERAVEPLIAALKDADLVFRGEAALSLIRLGNPGVEALLATFDEQSLATTVSDYKNVIGEGQDESLPILVAALMRGGNITMAEDYLNCGQEILAGAGGVWAGMNGFNVMQNYGGSSGATWGVP